MEKETPNTTPEKLKKASADADAALPFGKTKSGKEKSGQRKFGNEEIEKMLNKMQEMGQDLQTRLEEIQTLGKEKHIDLDKYFGDTYRLTKQELEQIEERERIVREKVNAAFPPESCIRPVGKSKEKLTKDRKGKMRGARQNWIPIR